MSKHTPGPWHIGGEAHGDFYIWGPDPSAYGYIAQANACGSKTNPREEREANARLIAASPDLLAALKDMRSGWLYIRQRYGDLDGVGWDRCMAAAESAIAKAEGGTDAKVRTD